MNDQNTDQIQGVAPVESDPGPEHVEPQVASFEVPKGAKDTGRFSAFDTTYGKYVGGVHDSKDKARKAAKDKGSTTVEIVEV